jgi:hypothetical protein
MARTPLAAFFNRPSIVGLVAGEGKTAGEECAGSQIFPLKNFLSEPVPWNGGSRTCCNGGKRRMYRILEGSEDRVVGIKIENKLSTEEYDLLGSYLEQLMLEMGSMNFLCDMAALDGKTSQSIWDTMKSSLPSLRNYQKIALVGKLRWQEKPTSNFQHSLQAQFKTFTPSQIDEAWLWVKSFQSE